MYTSARHTYKDIDKYRKKLIKIKNLVYTKIHGRISVQKNFAKIRFNYKKEKKGKRNIPAKIKFICTE